MRPLLWTLSLLLCACPPTRRGGGGDDDDTTEGVDFGALDRDGDGTLDTDDLQGDAALLAVEGPEGLLLGQGSGSAYESGSGNWTVELEWDTADTAWLFSMSFANQPGIPGPMRGAVTWASLSEQTSFGTYAYRQSPGGEVDVLGSGDGIVVGALDGTVSLDAIDPMTEQLTGVTWLVHGAAFQVPLLLP